MHITHASLANASRPTDARRSSLATRIAPRAMGHAALAGIAADALLRDGISGPGFPIWVLILILAFASLTWRAQGEVTGEAAMWLGVAALSACGLVWRDAGMLQFLDFGATAGALGMAAIALGSPHAGIIAERFRDTIYTGLAAVRVVASGLAPNLATALHESQSKPAWKSGTRRGARSALLAFGILVVFGSLLRSADPIFASLISLPDFDLGVAFSHIVFAGVAAWVVCGWANAALGSRLLTTVAPNRLPFSLDVGDLTSSLGVLITLFAVFMLTQLGWLFGGESLLRARTGLTAAQYARSGFFEMGWVVTLVIPLLLVTRAALVPGREATRRHTLLSLPLLVLLSGIIISAAARMQLYVHYYGLTVDRLYPLVFMGWLAFVVLWLGVTVLRNNGQRFIAGCAASAFLVLVALNVAAPDRVVARYDEGRIVGTDEDAVPDVQYMSHLSADAVDVALRATLDTPRAAIGSPARTAIDDARCVAAGNLVYRWGPTSSAARDNDAFAAWRIWNAGRVHAVEVVGANMARLRTVQHSLSNRRVGCISS